MEAVRTTLAPPRAPLADAHARVRAATLALCAPLSAEDCCAQSMPDASPAKWHLAHTTWFFERFLIAAFLPGYRPFDPAFDHLWNSYYDAIGDRHPRPLRGLLTRPSLECVLEYRRHVDEHVHALLARLHDSAHAGAIAAVVRLGLAHEQHQELLVTDVKHLLSLHPLQPAYRAAPAHPRGRIETRSRAPVSAPSLRWLERPAGLALVGADADGAASFTFDHEHPRHRVWLEAHALANRPVTNGEFREFVLAGGYRRPQLWMSDGWALAQAQGWSRPAYWEENLDFEFTLAGVVPLDPSRPVCHLSWYEADAYARWCGARLPTEAEWECAAEGLAVDGHFADSGELHPRSLARDPDDGLPSRMYGDVWEWTASPYAPYPGYRPAAGALGEYNGKFMCNQYVLRGGSCATPPGHVRPTYRNFFPPHARWQFSGFRLARDA